MKKYSELEVTNIVTQAVAAKEKEVRDEVDKSFIMTKLTELEDRICELEGRPRRVGFNNGGK